jgi:P-type conjugative transfer protein TrbJ
MMNRRMQCIAILLSLSLPQPPAARAQWVVTDPTNLVQNIISAIQDVNAVLKQVQQYKTQLDQYTAQLRDIASPAVWTWDLVEDTVATAQDVAEKFGERRNLLKDVHASLKQLGDPDYYRNSPCYGRSGVDRTLQGGCGAILEAFRAQQEESVQTQYEANELLFETLDKQHESMKKRLERAQKLVKHSQDAQGQLQAVQATNQLVSAQIAELMELRSLLITQQNLQVEGKRQELAQQAAAQAATSSFFGGEHKPTPTPQGW